ncbi:arginase family protein [Mycolicibacterium sp. P1-18]|uniref:arginase family protein n=1 Tax=Mycolicibacterium sp. P1-18 TaxID=2024615 RepID=UPI0011F3903F|nr:arginase family protein [Mycolicibacterium sp. P1-18]KAA0097684.1 arginase family protein [Mycolicibacterium sp. P1-18]
MATGDLELVVFVGPTGDHNDRGMAGAPIVGRELSRRLRLEPTTVGDPRPATSAPWHHALRDARPGLFALRDTHADIMSRGHIPILAASRCAASLATLPNVAALRPDAVVVWFDAHADLNTPAGSTTGYLGGLVLSAAVGWWESGLGSGLAPDHIVLGASRDLDPPEQALVDDGTIKLAAGPHLMDLLDRYVGDAPVYVHLDCDVLEPDTVPTDYRVPGGLGLDDLGEIATRLGRNDVVGVEVAEFEAAAPDDHTDYAQPLVDALAPLWARRVSAPWDTAL